MSTSAFEEKRSHALRVLISNLQAVVPEHTGTATEELLIIHHIKIQKALAQQEPLARSQVINIKLDTNPVTQSTDTTRRAFLIC